MITSQNLEVIERELDAVVPDQDRLAHALVALTIGELAAAMVPPRMIPASVGRLSVLLEYGTSMGDLQDGLRRGAALITPIDGRHILFHAVAEPVGSQANSALCPHTVQAQSATLIRAEIVGAVRQTLGSMRHGPARAMMTHPPLQGSGPLGTVARGFCLLQALRAGLPGEAATAAVRAYRNAGDVRALPLNAYELVRAMAPVGTPAPVNALELHGASWEWLIPEVVRRGGDLGLWIPQSNHPFWLQNAQTDPGQCPAVRLWASLAARELTKPSDQTVQVGWSRLKLQLSPDGTVRSASAVAKAAPLARRAVSP